MPQYNETAHHIKEEGSRRGEIQRARSKSTKSSREGARVVPSSIRGLAQQRAA
ncbi:hypothetical protein M440DRAFT_1404825 [Trichoderma longibrachiatum ATCC 18648]|uniref:Uncharacterized protein n=1 Tax=Trichoderma longibrachiatum ATCC 18648 TaxID=983965 RepID=A0A2T4BUW7_TRILO|nr:hypothetical protein M440DRAFT_1404825 [Trichoderma longibrachiatum ATCC 18648]